MDPRLSLAVGLHPKFAQMKTNSLGQIISMLKSLLKLPIINILVTETNRYASQVKEKRARNVGPHSHVSNWKDVSFDKREGFSSLPIADWPHQTSII